MSAQKEHEKEDYLAPTPLPEDKESKRNRDVHMSEKELHEKLALYGQVRSSYEQNLEVERIKQKYLSEMKEREANRAKQDIHYAQGIRSGLHPGHYDQIKSMREHEDNKLRNQVLTEAKESHLRRKKAEKTNSMREWIKESFHKAKDRDQDMDR